MVTKTFQIPDEIEDRLRRMADRTGRDADQLMLDALEHLLAEPSPLPAQPWPKSIGIVDDGRVDSSRLDEWLDEHWT